MPRTLPRVAIRGVPSDSCSRQRHGVCRSLLEQAQARQLAQRRGRGRTLGARGVDELLGAIELALRGGVGGLQQRRTGKRRASSVLQSDVASLRAAVSPGSTRSDQRDEADHALLEVGHRHRLKRPARGVVIDDHASR